MVWADLFTRLIQGSEIVESIYLEILTAQPPNTFERFFCARRDDAALQKISARLQFFGGDHDALFDSVAMGARLKTFFELSLTVF